MNSSTKRTNNASLERAREVIAATFQPLETEFCGLINALGRTAADDITIPGNLPVFDTATTEGYAVYSADTSGASAKTPVTLSVLSRSLTHASRRLRQGTVVRVKAGGRLPSEADAIVPLVHVFCPPNDPQAHVMAEVSAGDNVSLAGSAAAAGEEILPRGSLIRSSEIALAAGAGLVGIPVIRKPRVTLITTGSDVVDVVDRLSDGQMRNTARYGLAGMILETGSELGRLIHVTEGRKGLEKELSDCSGCDAVLIAVSQGDRADIATRALSGVGEVLFDRVQISPGGNWTAFGVVDDKPVFVVPADWALEVFEALVRPGLLTIMGRRELGRPQTHAEFAANVRLDPAYRHFLKAHSDCKDGKWLTRPLDAALQAADKWRQPNSLIVIPENIPSVRRGQMTQVILLPTG